MMEVNTKLPRQKQLPMLFPFRCIFVTLIAMFLQSKNALLSQHTLSDSLDQAILKPYTAHHSLKKELLYIQANKETFVPGEPIAFKVYITSRNRMPFLETSNVYIDCYSLSGEIISQQILYAEDGIAHGMIQLPSSIKSGSYFVKAYTSWSRIWGKDGFFLLPIQIIGGSVNIVTSSNIKDNEQLEIFSEGGAFIEDVKTRFGFKFNDNPDLEQARKIKIKKNGLLQQTLTTNQSGFADCYITAGLEDQITAEWEHSSGVQRSIAFPKPLVKGVSLTIPERKPGAQVIMQLHTNKGTLMELGEKKFYLLFHSRGVVKKLLWISFINRKLILEQKLSAVDLPEGITHITLFGPDFKPIADRAIYINSTAAKPRLETFLQRKSDSLVVEVNAFSSEGKPLQANFGATFLPGGSKAAQFRSSLYSRNYLEEDIDNHTITPTYFFEARDSAKSKEMDLMLLVHGWKRYDWNAILNEKYITPNYPFEQGFVVKGRILDYSIKQKEKSDLILSDPLHQLFIKAPIDSGGRFEFKKVFLQNPSSLTLFASNIKSLRRFQKVTIDSVSNHFDTTLSFLPLTSPKLPILSSDDLYVGSKFLQNVTVRSKRKNTWNASFDLATATERFYPFSETERIRYTTLKDYLRARYNIRTYFKEGVYHFDFSQTNSINLTSDPVLIIDGAQISDMQMIERISLRDIESISVNTRGSNDVAFGSGGHVILKTRSPLDETDAIASNVLKKWLMHGYSLPSAYYMPSYSMPPDSESFRQYACLYWKSDIITDTSGKARFTFLCPKEIANIEYIIEGLSPQGEIFYERKSLNIK